jgi:hypothetical protein
VLCAYSTGSDVSTKEQDFISVKTHSTHEESYLIPSTENNDLAHIYSANSCVFIGGKMVGRCILEKNET